MRFVEKTCPKCGANLEFVYGDKETKCSYCNKSFIIEGYNDDLSTDNINLIYNEYKKNLNINKIIVLIAIIIIFVIFIFIIMQVFFSFKQIDTTSKIITEDMESINKEKEKKETTKNYNFLNDISSTDLEELQNKSLVYIKEWNHENDKVVLNSYNRLGEYLLVSKTLNTLYDVYELNYLINNNSYTIYTAIKYNNVTFNNNKLKVGSKSIYGNILNFEYNNLWGYNSQEDLYYSIETPFNEDIYATENLYK
jgi:hypothetical protein